MSDHPNKAQSLAKIEMQVIEEQDIDEEGSDSVDNSDSQASNDPGERRDKVHAIKPCPGPEPKKAFFKNRLSKMVRAHDSQPRQSYPQLAQPLPAQQMRKLSSVIQKN
mmetsp:Transcript_3983/g.6747  ORF Transcript_3983/g.6747 Transcript_3983/m.6747 type:complete len:108 (-) Transcript_3983:500-823(-)